MPPGGIAGGETAWRSWERGVRSVGADARIDLATQKSAALFPKSGTSLFKTVQYKNPKITRDTAPQTAIITTAARMGGSHCRARPG